MPQRTPRRATTQKKGITFSDDKQTDDAGKRSAVKVARCVWRGAFGTGQYCTSPGAYPTVERPSAGPFIFPSVLSTKEEAGNMFGDSCSGQRHEFSNKW